MTPRVAELDRRQRRRNLSGRCWRSVLTGALLLGIYYLIPFTDRTSGESLTRLVVGVVAFAGVLAWQLHQVRRDDLPGLRAIQALGVTIPFFLAGLRRPLPLPLPGLDGSLQRAAEPHRRPLPVITLFSTVGFGDITPETDLTRILVSIQMLLDLVVIGAVVRLLAYAAKTGVDT